MEASEFDTDSLLADWRWLVSPHLTPLMISIFGDWVFGAPDGTLWALSMLNGSCDEIAGNALEFNALKCDPEWVNQMFLGEWLEIAERHGFEPGPTECLGWKVHPLIGGKFGPENLQVFSMRVYQSLMGQLHRQVR
jgi:hypothetical protein